MNLMGKRLIRYSEIDEFEKYYGTEYKNAKTVVIMKNGKRYHSEFTIDELQKKLEEKGFEFV